MDSKRFREIAKKAFDNSGISNAREKKIQELLKLQEILVQEKERIKNWSIFDDRIISLLIFWNFQRTFLPFSDKRSYDEAFWEEVSSAKQDFGNRSEKSKRDTNIKTSIKEKAYDLRSDTFMLKHFENVKELFKHTPTGTFLNSLSLLTINRKGFYIQTLSDDLKYAINL